MKFIRTAIVATFMGSMTLFGLPWLALVHILRLTGFWNLGNRLFAEYISLWGRGLLFFSGIRYEVSGLENLPEHSHICFVGNHQSLFDVPLIFARIKKVIGFVSKKELTRIPLLGWYIRTADSPFIDRNNREKSLKAIEDRLKRIKNKRGHAMLIFPEGTRSRTQEMKPFKTAGLKTVIDADVMLIPMTVCNTYRIFEGSDKNVSKGKAKLFIHKPFLPSETGKSFEELVKHLEDIIDPLQYINQCE